VAWGWPHVASCAVARAVPGASTRCPASDVRRRPWSPDPAGSLTRRARAVAVVNR
jgi:hypothetical protein